MQANYEQRLRFTFSKIGPTRYIGHLDLARALERTLNRARIPFSYTQGYNRRPRMQFASALPLGFTSEAELADIWLEETRPPAEVHERLALRMAPGIVVHEVKEIPLSWPNLQTVTERGDYVVEIDDPADAAAVKERVQALLAQEEAIRIRRGKKYDLRQLIHRLELRRGEGGSRQLFMSLALRPGETGRPDELLLALGLDPLDMHIHRVAIVLDERAGQAE